MGSRKRQQRVGRKVPSDGVFDDEAIGDCALGKIGVMLFVRDGVDESQQGAITLIDAVDLATGERSHPDLLELLAQGPGLRHISPGAWFHLHSALGLRRRPVVLHATGRLLPVWGDRRGGAVSNRQGEVVHGLPALPRFLGQAPGLVRHRAAVSHRAVEHVVPLGLGHRNLDGIKAIGIDEIAVWSGHRYLTVVYQLDAGVHRLTWVGYGRTKGSCCRAFFVWFGRARRAFSSSSPRTCGARASALQRPASAFSAASCGPSVPTSTRRHSKPSGAIAPPPGPAGSSMPGANA